MIISDCGKCCKIQKSKQNGIQKHKFIEFEKTGSHCVIQSGLKLTVGRTITVTHNHS